MIRCGDHKHETVAQVKACQLGVRPSAPKTALERLGRQEVHPMFRTAASTPATTTPATERQLRFLSSLLDQRDIPSAKIEKFRAALDGNATLSKQAASNFIKEILDTCPPKIKKASPERSVKITGDGIYRNPTTGEIYKVQWNRGSGDGRNLYAKQLVLTTVDGVEHVKIDLEGQPQDASMRWEYVKGAVYKIEPDWKMSLEEAARFGALYGRCLRCGRTLTAEESIERAMGPVCADKGGWA